MYGKEKEGRVTKIIITMLLIVLVLMIGYSVYKVEHSEVIPKENEIKVLKVENWDNNTSTFEIDNLEKIEFVLDASGSNVDVNYKITLFLKNADNIKLYSDEYHLYESENVINGTIKHKETMKQTITIYIEHNETTIINPSDEIDAETIKPTLDIVVEIEN